MKKIFAILLLVSVVIGLSACNGGESESERETFTVGMECDYAPFNWFQTEAGDTSVPVKGGGYADGYDVQIAKRIAESLDMDLVIEKIEWDGLSLALNSNMIDAIIAGMSPLEERKLTIDFSEPYYESDLVIVISKNGAYTDAAELADFSGAKITGQLNTFHYTIIPQIPGVDRQAALETFPAMIVALSSGSIDGYVSERPGALSAVAANPELAFIEFEEGKGFQASQEDVAISVGLRKGEDDLRAKINTILEGISREERNELMEQALLNQPLSAE